MTRLPNRRLLALALAAGFGAPALAQAAEPFTVSDIRVDGLQRITSGTVFTYLPIDSAVEDMAIQLRRSRRVKLPDALIAATVLCHGLQLLSMDLGLQSVIRDNRPTA